MNGLHLHLILNHLPVLGVLFGAALLLAGLLFKSRPVQQTGLAVLVLAALAAAAAYLTGEGAEEAIEATLAGGKPYLELHESAGLVGLGIAGIVGVLALFALVSGRKGRQLSRRLVLLSVLGSVAASGTLAWVANSGGQIGHPEIRSGLLAPGNDEHETDDGH